MTCRVMSQSCNLGFKALFAHCDIDMYLVLQDAYSWVVRCRPKICLNRGFRSQLEQWEAKLNKKKVEGITESVLNVTG